MPPLPVSIARRLVAPLFLSLSLAACAATTGDPRPAAYAPIDPADAGRYGAVADEPFEVAAVPKETLSPRNLRQLIDDPTGQPPGTIVVDPASRFLYLVQEDGKALRYGVGVGRDGMEWSGTADVALKREWPRWTPTQDMIARDPERYAPWAAGMDGGSTNPLGARALYLFQGGRDTLYRIHGTNDPASIGQAMSSGCIRMMNQDIIDLYGRVTKGAKVVVLPAPGSLTVAADAGA